MEDIGEQIDNFLNKCQELKNCKFIMASTKIRDLLKAIVNSRVLYDLFSSVSSDFDYLAAKSKYLLDISDGFYDRGMVVLPQSSNDTLAFIFCLLVELDRNTINFNYFLQKYFSDNDGSFYGSYFSFCEQIILPFEQIIVETFADYPNGLDNDNEAKPVQQQGTVMQDLPQMLSNISYLLSQEKQYILESSIPYEDKECGYMLLTELYNALKGRNFEMANAIARGYNYYILYNKTFSSNARKLFESIEQYKKSA